MTGRVDPTRAAAIDDEIAEQFRAMGVDVPDDAVTEAAEYKVWAPNWPAVTAFLGSSTQWRMLVGPERLIWTGLDYAAVDVVLRRGGYEDDVLADLMVMESAALEVLNERT
jgi:Phage related hypothetical protein (DUF1799)